MHYAKSYRPFELFVNENYKLRNELNYLNSLYHSVGDWVEMEVELVHRGFFYLSRKWFSVLCVL